MEKVEEPMKPQAFREEEEAAIEMERRRSRSSGDLEMQERSKPEMERQSNWVKKTPGAMTITCLMLLSLLFLVTESPYSTTLDRLLPHGIRARIGKKFTSISVKESRRHK